MKRRHVMASVMTHIAVWLVPYTPLWLCLAGLEDRITSYLLAPRYESLDYVIGAYERLQSCPSDHRPRRVVIITLPAAHQIR